MCSIKNEKEKFNEKDVKKTLHIGNTLFAGGHMQMTAFYDKYSEKHKCIANIIYCSLGVLVFGILTVSSGQQFFLSMIAKETMSSPRVIYYWWGKLAVPVGSAVFVLAAIGMIVTNVKELAKGGK